MFGLGETASVSKPLINASKTPLGEEVSSFSFSISKHLRSWAEAEDENLQPCLLYHTLTACSFEFIPFFRNGRGGSAMKESRGQWINMREVASLAAATVFFIFFLRLENRGIFQESKSNLGKFHC